MWDEIIYPFPNLNGATVEVWEWISNFTPDFTVHVRLQLIHVSKRDPGCMMELLVESNY